MPRIWVNKNQFVDIENPKTDLAVEFAPRSRSIDWLGVFGFLPDPDEVLEKLGQDMSIYRSLLSDAHVGSCYLSRKSGSLSCEWDIREPAENLKRVNKQVMDVIVSVMTAIDVYQVITDILEAPFYGLAPLEVIWKSESVRWLPERVVGKPPEWFAFTEDNELRFKSKDNMIEGEALPPYRFISARHHASYLNPYGDRLLARCFWPVTFKRGGWKFWSIFTEKYGMPWAIGRVPRSTNETERGALLTNLSAMIQDAVAVINNDESIDIKESGSKSASADIYDKLISAANREISKAILGQTLSTEIDKGGSFAASKSHMEVRADLVEQDKRMVKSCFNKLFQWICELNFSGAQAPEFIWYEDEDIQTDRSERDESLTKQGVKFTRIYYQRRYNLEEDEFEIGEPAPAAAGKMTEFAETKRFSADQQALEDLIDAASEKAAKSRDMITQAVLQAVSAAKDYDDLQLRLIDALADKTSAADLEDILTRVMTAAHLWGRSQDK